MRPPTRAAIAADSPLTVSAGVVIAEAGGNAVDIAVAAALAASLAEILMCSLGGSAFLVIEGQAGRSEAIDGADAVPSGHHRGSPGRWWDVHLPYGDGITVRAGPGSVAVPGMLAALHLAWSRHGSLPWRDLVAPALRLAREGFPMGRTTAQWLSIAGSLLFDRQAASRECFAVDPADPPREGRWCRIPGMAASLELIAAQGAEALYRGDLAEVFARELGALGGYVTREDLAHYRARVRQPLELRSRGFRLALNPPPAIGGLALGSLIRLVEESLSAEAPAAERVVQRVRAQRALFTLRRRQGLGPGLSTAQAKALLAPEVLRRHLGALASPHTTHLSVATGDGSLVAVTLSNGYGSGITIPGTGIACNNSLGEPELNPEGFLTAPSGSRLVSNMAPTLVRHPDGHGFAFGTPGASRITTAMAQVWERHTLEGLPLEEAITAPRLHVQAGREPPLVLCEPGLDLSLLEREPHLQLRLLEAPDMFFGGVKLAVRWSGGELEAFADRRRQGAVAITGSG